MLCLCLSFGMNLMGGLLLILSKYLGIWGLGGCNVWVGIISKSGLASGCFWSFFLVLSSSSSQSEDNANLLGQSLPKGVHMAQYLDFSVTFVEAAGEGMRVGMEYCPLTDFLTLEPGLLMHCILHL